MRTPLPRLAGPDTRVTSPRRTPKALATARSAASVALPATGRAVTRTTSASPRLPRTSVRGAPGRTRMATVSPVIARSGGQAAPVRPYRLPADPVPRVTGPGPVSGRDPERLQLHRAGQQP